jgi:hypothetical protein
VSEGVVEGVVFIAGMKVDGWPLISSSSGPDYSEEGQGRLLSLHVINFGSTMTAFAAAYSYNISTTFSHTNHSNSHTAQYANARS